MSDYNQNQYGENRGYDNQNQYGENRGYDNQQQHGNQPGYGNQNQYGENRGFDEQQQGEDGERGFFGNAGQAISNYTYKDKTYTDKHGVEHNKIDKSHAVIEGLGVAAVGGLAYTAYEKFAHKDDTPEQQQQRTEGEGNFFKNEDGSIRKTHAALAGIGAVGAGLLAKKIYDNFEERNLPEENHSKHHERNNDRY
ncbi:hypothetical protein FBU31_005494 [Coemansia sp. 'formosensis']|uniref:Uncharacterized protein n=1 Tax=Coemansia furcata TaxID=417177 RepID=A0ACC1LRS5_9FUNG|nr:hypothetical protein H4S07_000617 [Coemansia furcata]KAJ2819542.1 hypothetical protein FBU31_005494 [Coemansia sp. 'formosensis']